MEQEVEVEVEATDVEAQAKQERDWTAESNARCMPIVMEIFKIISEMPKAPINTDETSKEECYKIYWDTQIKIRDLFVARDIDIEDDFNSIWMSVNEIMQITNKMVSETIKTNHSQLLDSIFGVKEGEPSLHSAVKLGKMLANKDKISNAINEILDEYEKKDENK